MAAPTRRAPPVISTVLPVRLPSCSCTHALYDFSRIRHNPAAAERRRARAFAARGRSTSALSCSERGGVIGFDAWMRLALYAPGLGYYSAGATKFGGAGDFVTAPEISQPVLALPRAAGADVLQVTGGDILELGAGSGPHGGRRAHRARRAGCAAGAILHPRSERGSRRAPACAARASCRASVARAGAVVRPLAGARHARRGAGQRGARRDAGGAFRAARRGPAASKCARWAWRWRAKGSNGARPSPSPELMHAVSRTSSRRCPRRCPTATCPRCAWRFSRGWPASPRSSEQGVALLIDYGLPRAHLYHPERVDGHAALPLPPPRARRSVHQRGPAGHHRLGGFHARRRSRRQRRARGAGLRDARRRFSSAPAWSRCSPPRCSWPATTCVARRSWPARRGGCAAGRDGRDLQGHRAGARIRTRRWQASARRRWPCSGRPDPAMLN